MCDENILPDISHWSLPNPSKTQILLVRLPVLSHTEHKTIASTWQLCRVSMGQMWINPAHLFGGAQHPSQLNLLIILGGTKLCARRRRHVDEKADEWQSTSDNPWLPPTWDTWGSPLEHLHPPVLIGANRNRYHWAQCNLQCPSRRNLSLWWALRARVSKSPCWGL